MFGYRLEQRLDIQSVHASCRLLELHRIAVIVRVSAAYLYRKPLYVLRVADYDALTGDTVEDGEIELIVVSFQIHEEFVYFVNYFVDPGVLLIQLVYKEDGVQTLFQRLLQYEPCLRHGTF